MVDQKSNHLSDEEIVERAHDEQEKAALLGVEKFGVAADAIDVLRYRMDDWRMQRNKMRPLHTMRHLYRGNPPLARELAVHACFTSALNNIVHVAPLLRSGIIGPIPTLYRVAHELWVDATFLRLDASGHSAVRMLDWQLADTAKVSPENLDLQANYAEMKEAYQNDNNYAKPGRWAELPNGKKYHNAEVRAQYVYGEMEKEVPEQVLSVRDWPFIKEVSRNQRDQANASVHSSPIAGALIDKQIFMALHAALLLLPTMTAFGKVSDEWRDQNFETLLSEMPEALIEDELAWERVGSAWDRFIRAVGYTFAMNNTKTDSSQGRT